MQSRFLKLGDLIINVDRILYVEFCPDGAYVLLEDKVSLELDIDQTELLRLYFIKTSLDAMSIWDENKRRMNDQAKQIVRTLESMNPIQHQGT